MKQNEKVLVYAVTGFLLVILGIAILFGKDGPRRAPKGDPGEPKPTVANAGKGTMQDLLAELVNKEADKGAVSTEAAPATTGLPAPTEQPLSVAPPPSVAELVALKLGDSRRDRDFRVVKARRGDSLSVLAERWCGSVKMLDQVMSMNEGLVTLREGQEVWVPWVEDDELIAALDARQAPAASAKPAGVAVDATASNAGAVVPAFAPKPVSTRTYKLKPGDKLWNLAVSEAGLKGAPAFLEELKRLNPQVPDLNRVRDGLVLNLPPKS